MTKKERVCAAIRCEEPDAVPSCFSLHFPAECNSGEAGVRAHLDFFRETDTDILKIMNENLVPNYGRMDTAERYASLLPAFGVRDAWMARQLDFTRRILDGCEKDAFTLGTLHGIVASALHPIEKMGIAYDDARALQVRLLRENPQKMLSALHRIADGMSELARGYIEAGLDGVYYAALGGENRHFTDEEFAEWIEPLDKQIMTAVREAGGACVLHICKDGLNMQRYRSYADFCDVVNWGVYEAPMSLEEGRRLFPGKAVMGGLPNRHGVLVDGDAEAVRAAVQDVIRTWGRRGLILGADCTLATEQDLSLVRAAVQAARG